MAKNERGRSIGGEGGRGTRVRQRHDRQADKIELAGKFIASPVG